MNFYRKVLIFVFYIGVCLFTTTKLFDDFVKLLPFPHWLCIVITQTINVSLGILLIFIFIIIPLIKTKFKIIRPFNLIGASQLIVYSFFIFFTISFIAQYSFFCIVGGILLRDEPIVGSF